MEIVFCKMFSFLFMTCSLRSSPVWSKFVCVCVFASISISLLSLSSLLSHKKCVSFINCFSLFRSDTSPVVILIYKFTIHRFPICPRRILLAMLLRFLLLLLHSARFSAQLETKFRMNSQRRWIFLFLFMFHGRMYDISLEQRFALVCECVSMSVYCSMLNV